MKQQITLVDNVYHVKGVLNSCIYDLRMENAYIYHLDADATAEMTNLLSLKCHNNPVNSNQFKLYSFLKDHGLIRPRNDTNAKNLHTLGAGRYFIKSAWLELTSRCNAKCFFCYGSYNSNGETISASDITLAVESIASIGVDSIKLTGGEPLMDRVSTEFAILESKRIGINNIEIQTNGFLIDKRWVQIFKLFDVSLAITVYGSESKDYMETPQVSDGLNRHIKAFQLLNENNIKYRTSFIRTKISEDMVIDNIQKKFNLRHKIREDIIRPSGLSKKEMLTDSLAVKQQISISNFTRQFWSKEILKRMKIHNCFGNSIFIAKNLNISPCVMEQSIVMGNLHVNSIEDIMTRNSHITRLTKDQIAVCMDCEYRYACFDCRPHRSCISDLYSKPANCNYSPTTGTWE